MASTNTKTGLNLSSILSSIKPKEGKPLELSPELIIPRYNTYTAREAAMNELLQLDRSKTDNNSSSQVKLDCAYIVLKFRHSDDWTPEQVRELAEVNFGIVDQLYEFWIEEKNNGKTFAQVMAEINGLPVPSAASTSDEAQETPEEVKPNTRNGTGD